MAHAQSRVRELRGPIAGEQSALPDEKELSLTSDGYHFALNM
jgi:hypothetical protein